MPRFCANLNFLFTEVPLLDRFEAAAKAGFKAVEIGNPYEASAADVAARLKANGLALALFNTPAGDASAGERGAGRLPGARRTSMPTLATALALCGRHRLQADPCDGGPRASGRAARHVRRQPQEGRAQGRAAPASTS